MLKLLLIIVIVVSAVSCRSAGMAYDDFPAVIEVRDCSEVCSDDASDISLNVSDIEISNGVIALKLSEESPYLFAFVDAGDGHVLGKYGRRGRGPNEYTSVGSGFSLMYPWLVFADMSSCELNYVNVEDIVSGAREVEVRKESFPYTSRFRPRHIVPVGRIKAASGVFASGSIGILDENNEIADFKCGYPFDCEQIDEIYRGTVFQSKVKSCGTSNRFVNHFLTSDIFEVYSVSDTEVTRVAVNDFEHVPQLKVKPRPGVLYAIDYENSIAGLMNMAVSDSLICFTYSSRDYASVAGEGCMSCEIRCFDWNGNKVVKYLLPIPVGDFCIDGEFIYGVAILDERTVIYKFPMQSVAKR